MARNDTIAHRKARGAFFTPPEITRFIAAWSVRTPTDMVLEPSCGEAEFLLAAGKRLRELGCGLFAGHNLRGVEMHGPSAAVAQRRLEAANLASRIDVTDFFDLPVEQHFHAVIGNPPYVRYQDFSGAARSKAREAALRHGVRISGLASSWAAFTVYAAEFVAPGGRLGLVLPAELLSVKYAAEVRRFLLRRFRHIRLVMFEELVFPDVQEEIVLLLAEGNGPSSHFEVFQARDLSDLRDMDRAAWIPFVPGREDKWLRALLPTDAISVYEQVAHGAGFERLADWGNTYLGAVTGNNNYFTLSPERVRSIGLKPAELLRISPPGSRHLRGLAFSQRAWHELADADQNVYLFAPRSDPLSKQARAYVTAGEKMAVPKAFKCRTRSPWWRVPLVPIPDLLLTYMDRDRPRLVANRAKVAHLNSLYGVALKRGRRRIGMDLLPIASLNSVTLLGAEIVGRAYGGGMLKLEPREADNLPMPSLRLVEEAADALRSLRPMILRALRGGNQTAATEIVDDVLLTQQTELGRTDLKVLREARSVLFRRRSIRAKGSVPDG
jgi:adenine-specific DNA-methyltransferase